MIGSFGPQEKPHTVEFLHDESPEGIIARGTYNVHSKLVDDDKTTYAGKLSAVEVRE
jgi:Rho GDP-dissociation inhibitor